jgi:PAS domain S-box-containing protein
MSPKPPNDRTRAEDLLGRNPKVTPAPSTADAQALVHELQTRASGLEAQIAELRRAQVDLAASRDELAALFDLAPVGYLVLNREGVILKANRAAAALLGEERARLFPSRPFKPFIAPAAQDAWRLTWQHLWQEGAPAHGELTLLAPGEQPRVTQIALAPMDRSSAGEPRCLLTISAITAQKATSDAALSSQAPFRSVVESAMDAILLVDDAHRILHFNPAAERIFGCRAAEAQGQPVERFIPERLRGAHAAHIRDLAQSATLSLAMGEVTGLRADGTEFPMEGTLSQFEKDGRRVYTAIVHDISHRKRNEEQIRQHVQHLEALNDELSRFNRAAVGRELRMLELKQEVNALCVAAGQPPRYRVDPGKEPG